MLTWRTEKMLALLLATHFLCLITFLDIDMDKRLLKSIDISIRYCINNDLANWTPLLSPLSLSLCDHLPRPQPSTLTPLQCNWIQWSWLWILSQVCFYLALSNTQWVFQDTALLILAVLILLIPGVLAPGSEYSRPPAQPQVTEAPVGLSHTCPATSCHIFQLVTFSPLVDDNFPPMHWCQS